MDRRRNIFFDTFHLPYQLTSAIYLSNNVKNNLNFVQRLSLEKKLDVHNGCVNTICWNDNGQLILSGSDDRKLVLTDPYMKKKLVSIQTGHRANIFSAKFMPNTRDRQVVSCSGDGLIYHTYTDQQESVSQNSFDCHLGTTYEVLTVPQDPHSFLSCGEDGTVRWFDLRIKSSCAKENCKDDILLNCRRAVTAIATNPIAPYQLAVGCSDSSVRIYDRRMLGTKATGNYTGRAVIGIMSRFCAPGLDDEYHRITSLTFGHDGKEILVSYSSENIYLFDLTEADQTRQYNISGNIDPNDKNYGRHRPIKRLRLRGDWSDTGPSARPQHERGDEESQVASTVSDMLTRWLESLSSRNENRNASSVAPASSSTASNDHNEAPVDSSQPAIPTNNDTENRSDTNVSRSYLDSSEMNIEPSQPCSSNQSTFQETSPSQQVACTKNDDYPAECNTQQSINSSQQSEVAMDNSSAHYCPEVSEPNSAFENIPVIEETVKDSCSTLEFTQPGSSNVCDKSQPEHAMVECGVSSDPTSSNQSITETSSNNASSSTDITKSETSGEMNQNEPESAFGISSNGLPSTSTGLDEGGIVIGGCTVQPLVSLHYSEQGTCTSTIHVDCRIERSSNEHEPMKQEILKPAIAAEDSQSCSLNLPTITHESCVPESMETGESCDSRDLSEMDIKHGENCEDKVDNSGNLENLSESPIDDAPENVYVDDNKPSTSHVETVELGEASDVRLRRVGVSTTPTGPGVSATPTSPGVSATPTGPGVSATPTGPGVSATPTGPGVSATPTGPGVSATPTGPLSSAEPSDDSVRQRRVGVSATPTGPGVSTTPTGPGVSTTLTGPVSSAEPSDDEDDADERLMRARRAGRSRQRSSAEREAAARKLQFLYKKRQDEREKAECSMMQLPQPKMLRMYSGHRNARTMIKESTFWGTDYVISGSDCGHIFIWDKYTCEMVMLLEGDKHVVNCLQPHPFDPILATSGIDYDIKIWTPIGNQPGYDLTWAKEILDRNKVMLDETRDTITVPSSFMLRMLASLNNFRAAHSSNSALDVSLPSSDED